MRFDRNPLLVTLQDKYALRDYARSKGVQTAPLLYVTERAETIPFATLPPNYLIKANHGSGWNILCFDGGLYGFGNGARLVNSDGSFLNAQAAVKHKLSRAETIHVCNGWLARTYAKREWAYQQIRPQITIEELLAPMDGTMLKDYRMYTFRGVVRAINVGSATYRETQENIFLDPDWNEFPLTRRRESRPAVLPKRPGRLGEMVAAAQQLGADIDFARIDLYDTTRGVVAGEATVYPEAGKPDTPTACPVFNRWLGDQWPLSRADLRQAWMWDLACCVREGRRRIMRGLRGRRRA